MGELGRRTPTSWEHVEKYPFAALRPAVPIKVERILQLPWWHWTHDQGEEGSCVGHGTAMERAITNTAQNRVAGMASPTVRYGPITIWNTAKTVDEWPDTNPGDDAGTSVRAAYDVMRDRGAPPVRSMRIGEDGMPIEIGLAPYAIGAGVVRNRWATTIDEMRAAIALGLPVTIGIDWFTSFDAPARRGSQWWIGLPGWDHTRRRGGHCVCIYGASDAREAFRFKNSWGKSYPLAWLTYSAMETLLHDQGEAALVTDR